MTYKGSKYVCKGCAPFISAEATTAGERTRVMTRSAVQEATAADKEKDTRTAERQRPSSRYKQTLAFQRILRRLMLLVFLAILGALAYLPPLMQMAVEQSYGGGIDAKYAPRLVVLSARVHILYGREERAIEILEESTQHLPEAEQALAYFYLAIANAKVPDFEVARDRLRYFLSHWPKHERALEAGDLLKRIETAIEMKKLNKVEKPL
jgi:tetratricopeptide (TPR) repeat protein